MALKDHHYAIMDEFLAELRKKYAKALEKNPLGAKKAIRDILREEFRHLSNPGATKEEQDWYFTDRKLWDD